MKINLEEQNAERIATINKEMGELRDCFNDFKRENAVEHERTFNRVDSLKEEFGDIKKGITKLGWGLASSVAILIISIVITNLTK